MWPFDQSPNSATVTTTHVMNLGAPITRAYHDESDHGWQFFSEHISLSKDAMLVALQEVVEVDPTILEIADLPPGWMAQREAIGAPWRRMLQYADAAQIIVDWSQIACEDDFYDTIMPQCGSPGWHGRNLDALADCWVTGGIDRNGPPYAFGFFNFESTASHLTTFRDSVLKIADESIDNNGGRYIQQNEHSSDND